MTRVRGRSVAAALAVLAAVAWGGASQAGAAANVLWSAGHESGDISEWLVNGGGPQVTGSGRASVQDDVAHSGRYAMQLTISGADGTRGAQAIRMFRHRLIDASTFPTSAYYSVWLYFPVRANVKTFWDLIQWKTKLTSGVVDLIYLLNVGNRPDTGGMYFYLYNYKKRLTVATSPVDLPVGRWVQIETFYRWSTERDGQVTVYQDGRRIIDLRGVRTQLPSRNINARQWSVNNYSDDIRPSSLSIYVDDAAITRRRLGPRSWPQPPAPLSAP